MSVPIGQPSWEQIGNTLVIRATDRDASAVVVARNVQEVIFKSPFLTDSGFGKMVSKFHCGITSIDISGLHISDKELAQLGEQQLLRLRIFSAGGCLKLSGPVIARVLPDQLRELDLSGPNGIEARHWKTIAKNTRKVTHLNISRNTFDSQAIPQAFQDCWTTLRTLKARDCEGLLFDEVSKWPAFANGLISVLDVRESIKKDATALVKALPGGMQAVYLGEVNADTLKALEKKMPLSDIDVSRSPVTNEFVEAAKKGKVTGFHFNHCRRFPKEALTLFEGWPLKRLSLAGSTLTDEQLLKLSLDQLEELNVSRCPWLKGVGWGRLKLPAMKRLLLDCLKSVTDDVLGEIEFSRELCQLSLQGTSVTWKGILRLVKRYRPDQLVIPGGDRWIVEGGSWWKNTDFLTLLPYLTHQHTTVELHGFKQVSEEAWAEFFGRLAGVKSLTLSDCINIQPDQLWMIAEARSLEEITLKGLSISQSDAEVRLQQGDYKLNVVALPKVIDPDSEELGKAILAFRKNPKDEGAIEIFWDLKEKFSRARFYYGMSQGKEKGREYIEKAAALKSEEAKVQLGRWICEDEEPSTAQYEAGLCWLKDVAKRGETHLNEGRYWAGYYILLNNREDRGGRELIGRASDAGHHLARKLEKEWGLPKWHGGEAQMQVDVVSDLLFPGSPNREKKTTPRGKFAMFGVVEKKKK